MPDEDARSPACAACQLQELADAGVRCWKIAGRGYPGEMVERSVRFLRAAVASTGPVRESYARTFGRSCDGQRCYYRRGRTH
jgi:collagenase-like PrtC family protease